MLTSYELLSQGHPKIKMIINKSNCIYEANKNLHSTREAFLFLVHYFKIQMNWISIKVFHCITNIKCRHRFLLSYNITIKILLLFSAGSSFFWQFDKRITSLESCHSRNNKKKIFPKRYCVSASLEEEGNIFHVSWHWSSCMFIKGPNF